MRAPRLIHAVAFAAGCFLIAAQAQAAATITIINGDGPGEGFNDPTPTVEPAPGNPGTTRGAQALAAFQHAATIWGSTLDSDAQIFVLASFDPLTPCTPTSGVLGSAGASVIANDTPGVEYPGTLYHIALANKLAGVDLVPDPTPGLPHYDLRARFNSNLGIGTCLTTSGWYFGLDGLQPANRINLVAVLLHEFAHGLGFSQFGSVTTGALAGGLPDVYNRFIYDVTQAKLWPAMTNAQRQASAINSRKVVWTGLHSNTDAQSVLSPGTPLLTVNSPAAIAGAYDVGAATFGPLLSSPGVTGNVVLATDAAEPASPPNPAGTTTDGCSVINNAAAVAGNIALVDRGLCGFAIKVKNAQNAGAIAVIIADNVVGAPPAGMSGVDPTIVIPSGRITLPAGNTIKANLAGGVNATLGVDLSVLAGTEASTGLLHLNAPNPVQPGSSISHWDPVAFRNQLMEPSINADLTNSVTTPEDLTTSLFTDIGWFSDFDGVPDGQDSCIGSDTSATVVIDGCDSGAGNDINAEGCTISDLIGQVAAGASNHGQFVGGVSHLLNSLKKAGVITAAEKDAIQSCAGSADLP